MRLLPPLFMVMLLLSMSCRSSGQRTANGPVGTIQPSLAVALTVDDWIGVYASPREISGYTSTVLALYEDSRDSIEYRERFRSDVLLSDREVEQELLSGSCLIDNNTIYVPHASGFYLDGKPRLQASITRYTLVRINEQSVLLRDDALHALRTDNKLYDYGVLIKVDSKANGMTKLDDVAHPSVKLLYSDPTKPWNDPFVHGPNER